jgi:alpha-N-arabinofuranosidase
MRHRDLGLHPIQGTGHADLVEAHDGSWWAVMLAFRPVPVGGWYHHLGRETFLAPVTWTADGWPVINAGGAGGDSGGIIELEMEAPNFAGGVACGVADVPSARRAARTGASNACGSVRDDFDAPCLGFEWNYLRNPRAENYSLSARKGFLRLAGTPITLDDVDSPTFVGRRQQHFDCRVSTLVEFTPTHPGQEAGLTVLINNLHHYEIAVASAEAAIVGRALPDIGPQRAGRSPAEASGSVRPTSRCTRQIIVRKRIGDLAAVVACEPVPDGPIILEIKADQDKYEFSFTSGVEAGKDGRTGDIAFKRLDTGLTKYLSTEVAGGFTGVYFGIYATSPAGAPAASADFDWIEYRAT